MVGCLSSTSTFGRRGGYVVAPPSRVGERPYELVKTADGEGGLDWGAVTRLLEPERQRAAGDARLNGQRKSAIWRLGSSGSRRATATTASSGQPAGRSKPVRPSIRWLRRHSRPDYPNERSAARSTLPSGRLALLSGRRGSDQSDGR